MVTDGAGLVAVICESQPAVAAAMVHTLADLYGLRIAATVRTGTQVLAAAAAARPDLAVVDLASAATYGLRIVGELHQIVPDCAVILAAPPEFGGLRLDAVAAGAITLVVTSDLRPLQCGIERLIHTHGENCPSCAARERETYFRNA
ncbi:MAG: hypothetical protein WD794_05480 [Mycobacteriales bacterium]